jgi:hypothetical protein
LFAGDASAAPSLAFRERVGRICCLQFPQIRRLTQAVSLPHSKQGNIIARFFIKGLPQLAAPDLHKIAHAIGFH